MSNPLSPSIPPQNPAPSTSSQQPTTDATSDPLVDDGFTSVTWESHEPRQDAIDPAPFTPFSADPTSAYQHPNPSDELEAAAGGGGFQNVAGGGPEPFNDADPVPVGVDAAERRAHGEMREATREAESSLPSWEGRWVDVRVQDPQKEHEGSKDAHVTYAVVVRTNVPGYVSSDPASAAGSSSTSKGALRPTADLPTTARRRFQDFAFLQQHLTRLFPACVVPPIPDKHRLEYLRGDRFSAEFVEHRRQELQHFLTRVARHPTLARSMLVRDFLLSTQWNVAMHRHSAGVVTGAPGAPGTSGVVPPMEKSGLIDNVTDTFINAFARVRKPDERFLDLLSGLEKFEDNVGGIERLLAKDQKRSEDMAQDYVDLAAAYQGLGYLESGITEPLNRFAERMLDFSSHLRDVVRRPLAAEHPERQLMRSFTLFLASRTHTRSNRSSRTYTHSHNTRNPTEASSSCVIKSSSISKN